MNTYIEDVTRRFADAGYHAVAPHFFHRAGGGTAPYDDFAKVIPLYEGLDDDGILVDVDAAREHLHAAGWPTTGSRHRRVLLRRPGHVPRGVAPHARCGGRLLRRRHRHAAIPAVPAAGRRGSKLQTPWLGLFGDQDAVDPGRGRRAAARPRSSRHRSTTEIVRYPDAGHGFHCDQRDAYDEAAAKDGWNRTLDWFETHLGRSRREGHRGLRRPPTATCARRHGSRPGTTRTRSAGSPSARSAPSRWWFGAGTGWSRPPPTSSTCWISSPHRRRSS